jgi:hypoxanthine phosphoribosyltransferase
VINDVERVLFSEERIRAGVDALAESVANAYRGREFTVVSVLKGSCVFASDLIRRLPIPLELSFVVASSYRERTTAGEIDLRYFPSPEELAGRSVLLVDDILDTGRTLHFLSEKIMASGANDVATCVLFDKPVRRQVEIEADFKCFEIDDSFIVGYGLDFAGRYRNLPFVGELKPSVYAGTEPFEGTVAKS